MKSHPTWVRGLKQTINFGEVNYVMKSHPTWVRGLKPIVNTTQLKRGSVAPYVGAWIETVQRVHKKLQGMSHPTWVRGLKQISTT